VCEDGLDEIVGVFVWVGRGGPAALWGGGGGGRAVPYEMEGDCASYLLGLKKVVLVPLRVFILKGPQWKLSRCLLGY